MRQPIGVKAHSLIDYGFFAAAMAGPPLLGLEGVARALVPFKWHGRGESLAVPALAVAAAATGALDQPRAKPFFGALLTALAAVYTLTDWNDEGPEQRRAGSRGTT